MIINGGRYPEKFPKGPCRLPYLFLITIQPIPLEPVYDLAFLCDVVPIFGCNQEAFGGISPFIVDQDTYLTTDVLDTFLRLWYTVPSCR